MTANVSSRYLKPSWFIGRVFNGIVAGLTGMGLSVKGTRILAVRGRKSGEWRTTPVNLLTHADTQYLVSPRGHTQWVRNLRVSGEGQLRLGRRRNAFTARELCDAEKAPVLRAYLTQWGWEVGFFFEGVKADATDEQLAEIAPGFPVFQLSVK